MDCPALVDVVIQCIDERAIPLRLLFTDDYCIKMLSADVGGAEEIDYGDLFVDVEDSYPIRLSST
jgi:hypothetical protein